MYEMIKMHEFTSSDHPPQLIANTCDIYIVHMCSCQLFVIRYLLICARYSLFFVLLFCSLFDYLFCCCLF